MFWPVSDPCSDDSFWLLFIGSISCLAHGWLNYPAHKNVLNLCDSWDKVFPQLTIQKAEHKKYCTTECLQDTLKRIIIKLWFFQLKTEIMTWNLQLIFTVFNQPYQSWPTPVKIFIHRSFSLKWSTQCQLSTIVHIDIVS